MTEKLPSMAVEMHSVKRSLTGMELLSIDVHIATARRMLVMLHALAESDGLDKIDSDDAAGFIDDAVGHMDEAWGIVRGDREKEGKAA